VYHKRSSFSCDAVYNNSTRSTTTLHFLDKSYAIDII
jgi:hypothetical protein